MRRSPPSSRRFWTRACRKRRSTPTSINIYANYDYSDNTEVIVGYTANNSLSVRTTDIDNVGALIDAAFAAGANTLDNVQFTVQDDSEAREQALTKAVEDARRKADVLAAAAGMQVTAIESIAESGVYTYDSMRNFAQMDAAATEESGAGTLVQAALVSVDASVLMDFYPPMNAAEGRQPCRPFCCFLRGRLDNSDILC